MLHTSHALRSTLTRRALVGFTLLAGTAALTHAALAQAPAPPPPLTPMLLQYRYWPEQFVQFITGSDMPYSLVELDVDGKGDTARYEFTLAAKDGKSRVHYTNAPDVLAAEKAKGDEAYMTKFAFDRPDAEGKDATFELRTVLHDGKPVDWRFVQGSDMMEQGGGLTPLPQYPVPVFAYREVGSVAGDGTAISIGKQVAAAEVWTEISKPPYFVAYRGGHSLHSTTFVLGAGKEMWKVDASPASIAPKAVWKLSTEGGRTRTLTVLRVDGKQVTLRDEDSAEVGVQRTVTATQTDTGWLINQVHFVPGDDEKSGLTVTLTPTTLDILVGKKNKIASASIAPSDAGSTLTMKSPDWIKGKSLDLFFHVTPDGILVAAKPKM